MKVVYTGIESSGKSLQLSAEAERVLRRNIKWLRKSGVPRTMAFNTPMAKEFVARIERAGLKYVEYRTLDELLRLRGSDVFIDELLKFFPSRGSEPLPVDIMDFVTQGAKEGLYMYCASQDFSQVHKQFRLLVNHVYVVSKIIGSDRPHPTKPPIQKIWGLCVVREVRPSSFKGDSVTMDNVGFPSLYFINREDCARFNTSFRVPRAELPVKYLKKQREVYEEDGKILFEKTKYV